MPTANDRDISARHSDDGLVLLGDVSLLLDRVIDVHLNGHRVFSQKLATTSAASLQWPLELSRRLFGWADVELKDAATAEVLASLRVEFSESDEPFVLENSSGRKLSVGKWGHLQVALAGAEPELRERMISRTQDLIATLAALGHTTFIVGGTLLGAVRGGVLLPHDDDTDLAILVKDATHPSDLVILTRRLQRTLEADGFRIVRHSGAHLQVIYALDDGTVDHYIDIFLAFYRDGWFFEPLAMQVDADTVVIEPLSTVLLEGAEFPAPADPEGWLAACYGPGWRVPDPSFRFEVPERTTRRFWNWFGALHLHRDFWATEAHLDEWESSADWIGTAQGIGDDDIVVDLGAGRGATSRALHAAGRDVIAVDFSRAALSELREIEGLEVVELNLNDEIAVLDFDIALASLQRPVSFVIRGVYDGLGGEAKSHVLGSLRRLLPSGGVAMIDFFTTLPADFRFEDPTTWHVDPDDFERDIREAGLIGSCVEDAILQTPHGDRGHRTYLVMSDRRAR